MRASISTGWRGYTRASGPASTAGKCLGGAGGRWWQLAVARARTIARGQLLTDRRRIGDVDLRYDEKCALHRWVTPTLQPAPRRRGQRTTDMPPPGRAAVESSASIPVRTGGSRPAA